MNSNRRDFLQLLAAPLLFSGCLRKINFLSGPMHETIYTGYTLHGANSVSGIKFLTERNAGTQILQSEIHSVVHSESLGLKVYLPKAKKTAYYQIAQGPFIPFESAGYSYFYGHGVLDEEKKLFYSTQTTSESLEEVDQKSVPGMIHIHSVPDFKYIGSFSSGGFNPHDIVYLNGELVVCNGGDHSNVAFIDPVSKEVKIKFTAPEDHISYAHFAIHDDENLYVGTVTRREDRPATVQHLTREKGLKSLEIMKDFEFYMQKQILSIVTHEGHVYGSCPKSGFVHVWTLEGKYIGGAPVPSASSLVVSQNLNGVLIGSGGVPKPLHLARIENGKLSVTETKWPVSPTGSHALIVRK